MLREDVWGSPGSGRSGAAATMPADLARGLTFLRASNMQVMRLQLAMERADRRGVMAAIDELVGLDRELARFIETIPDPALDDIGRELEAQKHDLMAQRMVLARGKTGPALRPSPVPAPEPELLLGAVAPASHPALEADAPRPARRWPWTAAFLLIALLASAAAICLWFGESWGLDARLAALLEAVR